MKVDHYISKSGSLTNPVHYENWEHRPWEFTLRYLLLHHSSSESSFFNSLNRKNNNRLSKNSEHVSEVENILYILLFLAMGRIPQLATITFRCFVFDTKNVK